MKLNPLNIVIGQHIAVRSMANGELNSGFQGDVLQVKSIDLPYIVVETLTGTISARNTVVSLDTRRYIFNELNPDSILASQG